MTGARVDVAALTASLRRLTEQREDSDLYVSLRRVIDLSGRLFSVSGGGLMVADERAELRYVVASSGSSALLEHQQIDIGEGPCVDAYVRDEVTSTSDLAVDPRYPTLAPRVVPHGVAAVLAVPIHLSDIPIGSLNLYVDRPYEFDASEFEALGHYGDVVEATIYAAVAASHAGELADQLAYALEYRAPIERAVGYLMARDRTTQVRAFQTLRTATRSARRKIGDVALELLDTGHLPGEAR